MPPSRSALRSRPRADAAAAPGFFASIMLSMRLPGASLAGMFCKNLVGRQLLAAALATLLIATFTPGQTGQAGQTAAPKTSEITTQEAPTFTLRTERNLVLVRVVVHNAKGQAVGNLHQEDFRLFDNGKPQTISHFSVEGE